MQQLDLDFRPLKDRERTILSKLFERDFTGKAEIVEQCRNAMVKIIDAEGSFRIKSERALQANLAQRIAVEAYYFDTDEIIINVLLHVVDGWVDELEIVKFDQTPIISPPEQATFYFWGERDHPRFLA
jgi:hypothetical protein